MELTAVIEGLKLLTRPTKLKIVTDSLVVIQGAALRENAVKSKSLGNELQDAYDLLWDKFFDVAVGHNIEWEHVRGHSGHEINERCDRLAVKERIKWAKRTSTYVSSIDAEIQVYLSTQYSGKAKATAWAAVVIQDEIALEEIGLLSDKTELEATLIGAIRSLESLPPGKSATLFTAQEYLSKGMNQWLAGWQARGWKTRGGEPVKYQRHWQTLQGLADGRRLNVRFVKQRVGNPYFERGKELAAERLQHA